MVLPFADRLSYRMVTMSQFRRVIPLSLTVSGALLMVLIACASVSRPATPTALAGPAHVQAQVGQAGLELSAGYDQNAIPGSPITFTHLLTNTGVDTDSFAITATTPVTWPIELWSTSHLTESQPLSLTLGAGATATLYVSLTVPADTSIISGTQVPIVLTATSHISSEVFATITDTVIIQAPPGPITYTLYLPAIAK